MKASLFAHAILLFLSVAVATALDNDRVHPGLYPMVTAEKHSSLRRRAEAEETTNNCTLHKSLYFQVNTGHLWVEGDFIGQQGTAYGGQVPFYESEDYNQSAVAEYTWYTRFMYSEADGVGANGLTEGQTLTCMGGGAYTFGTPAYPFRLLDSITWQASCANFPYYTITGGQGSYLGVTGYVEAFIPTESGYRHDIYTC